MKHGAWLVSVIIALAATACGGGGGRSDSDSVSVDALSGLHFVVHQQPG